MTNRTNEAWRVVRERESREALKLGRFLVVQESHLYSVQNSQATKLAPEASAQVNVCAYFEVHTQEKINSPCPPREGQMLSCDGCAP